MLRKHSSDGSLSRGRRLLPWTRRLHFYLGLYFLLFIWFFSLSGLLLNHPQWEFSRFWSQRQESTTERRITPPTGSGDLAIAKDLIRELGIAGEINQTERRAADDRFTVQVVRPGRIYRIEADLERGHASIVRTELNESGIADALHKLTGVRMDDPSQQRDWLLTRIWTIAMDGLAIGLVIMVFSGLYLWVRRERRRLPGLLSLAPGTTACAVFVFVLAHIASP